MRFFAQFLLPVALLAASPAQARGLTVKTGETWVFRIANGQPAKARKASPGAQPAPGEILVSVRTMMGTTMTIQSNNPESYRYRAELVGADRSVPTRSCVLPANNRLSFENWPQKAQAVRLSDFQVERRDGSCP